MQTDDLMEEFKTILLEEVKYMGRINCKKIKPYIVFKYFHFSVQKVTKRNFLVVLEFI